jgi:hypothetical protein
MVGSGGRHGIDLPVTHSLVFVYNKPINTSIKHNIYSDIKATATCFGL